MKKILAALFGLLILAGCSIPQKQTAVCPLPEPVEPVTIVHECRCSVDAPTGVKVPTPPPAVEEDEVPVVEDVPVATEPDRSVTVDNGGFQSYEVVAGDTLHDIAREFGVTVEALQALNYIERIEQIFVGQILQIPITGQSAGTDDSEDVPTAVVDFLLNGQEDIPVHSRLNWHEDFLNALDLGSLHQDFIRLGGDESDVQAFARHLTQHAPIRESWEVDFQIMMFRTHNIQITRLEALGNNEFQAYTSENGVDRPVTIVSARTGHYSEL
jgi:LysM repeat protein